MSTSSPSWVKRAPDRQAPDGQLVAAVVVAVVDDVKGVVALVCDVDRAVERVDGDPFGTRPDAYLVDDVHRSGVEDGQDAGLDVRDVRPSAVRTEVHHVAHTVLGRDDLHELVPGWSVRSRS
ncbi:MAG: hypothetical protein R2849_14260 [Thermomicrobiales bacterium]